MSKLLLMALQNTRHEIADTRDAYERERQEASKQLEQSEGQSQEYVRNLIWNQDRAKHRAEGVSDALLMLDILIKTAEKELS